MNWSKWGLVKECGITRPRWSDLGAGCASLRVRPQSELATAGTKGVPATCHRALGVRVYKWGLCISSCSGAEALGGAMSRCQQLGRLGPRGSHWADYAALLQQDSLWRTVDLHTLRDRSRMRLLVLFVRALSVSVCADLCGCHVCVCLCCISVFMCVQTGNTGCTWEQVAAAALPLLGWQIQPC